MPSARFLQISDLHLGAPLGWLPGSQRRARRRDQQRALERAVALAVERGVDAILLPGDLFDREGVDAETIAFAVHAFGVPGCPPVLIAPGNHDPCFEASPYWSARLLRARGWAWPEHVHVFTSARFTARPLDGKPVTVWGRCFSAGVSSTERPLDPAALPALDRAEERIHVALFHGSREGACPPGQKLTAPFSDDEAAAAPFDYVAVGHYHVPSPPDSGRLAYAGSAVALDATETGAHGARLVAVVRDQAGVRIESELVPLDERRVHQVALDVSGAVSGDAIDRRIEQALAEAGVTERDIATVRVRGRIARGVRWSPESAEIDPSPFCLRLEAGAVRPDHDLDGYRREAPRTSEDRFARALLERLDAATHPEERALVESALYYGLDAFRLGEVAPRYEDLA